MVDGVPVGNVLPKTARRHMKIDNLQPGQTMNVYVAALSNSNTPFAVSKAVKVSQLIIDGNELTHDEWFGMRHAMYWPNNCVPRDTSTL